MGRTKYYIDVIVVYKMRNIPVFDVCVNYSTFPATFNRSHQMMFKIRLHQYELFHIFNFYQIDFSYRCKRGGLSNTYLGYTSIILTGMTNL